MGFLFRAVFGMVKTVVVMVLAVALGAYALAHWSIGRAEAFIGVPEVSTLVCPPESGQDRCRAKRLPAVVSGFSRTWEAAAARLEDGVLTARIKAKLALDDYVTADSIDVDTAGRVVTLTGTVGSDAERRRAVRLAQETHGAKSVVDCLSAAGRVAARSRRICG